MEYEFSQRIFEKSSNIKFHEKPSSRSRFVPLGRMDLTKLIVAFRHFTNAPQNYSRKKKTEISQTVTHMNLKRSVQYEIFWSQTEK